MLLGQHAVPLGRAGGLQAVAHSGPTCRWQTNSALSVDMLTINLKRIAFRNPARYLVSGFPDRYLYIRNFELTMDTILPQSTVDSI